MKKVQPITILYKPPVGIWATGKLKIKQGLINICEYLPFLRKKYLSNHSSKRLFGGGPTTRRKNLIKGLKQAKVPYRFQPCDRLVTKNVGVLSNVEALRWAIDAKRAGKIDFLIAGPNLVVLPATDYDGIIRREEIDVIITASKWVTNYWIEMAPELKEKIVEWPIGVDTGYWRPIEGTFRNHLLIYDKRGIYAGSPWQSLSEEKKIFQMLINLLEMQKETYIHVAYGTHSSATYKEMLAQCKGAIFLSRSETQGSAMFEAWAMNVPTLIWDPGKFQYNGVTLRTSSCPYLEKRNGIRFTGENDLEVCLDNFLNQLDSFSPITVIKEKFDLENTAIEYANLFPTTRWKRS